mmetsp:Transcript_15782/g.34780  ORF Transcript_15782/g.34780 Transcript_15782/m.34780 type:complete len:234 (+) Transcript_15782:698-1399(+)
MEIELTRVVGSVVDREMPEIPVDLEAVPGVAERAVAKGVVVNSLPHGLVAPIHQLPLVNVDRGLHLSTAGGPRILPLHGCLVGPQGHVRVQLVPAEGIQSVSDARPPGYQRIGLRFTSVPVATADARDMLEAMCHRVPALGLKRLGRYLRASELAKLLVAAAGVLGLAIHLHSEHHWTLHAHGIAGAEPLFQMGNRLALSLELVTASLQVRGAAAEPVGSRARLPVTIVLITE